MRLLSRQLAAICGILIFPVCAWAQVAATDSSIHECISMFCFERPASLRRLANIPVDSQAVRYRSDDLVLTIEVGAYPFAVDHLAQSAPKCISVGGRNGQVWQGEHEVVVIVRYDDPAGARPVWVSLSFRFSGRVSLEVLRPIVQSAVFNSPR